MRVQWSPTDDPTQRPGYMYKDNIAHQVESGVYYEYPGCRCYGPVSDGRKFTGDRCEEVDPSSCTKLEQGEYKEIFCNEENGRCYNGACVCDGYFQNDHCSSYFNILNDDGWSIVALTVATLTVFICYRRRQKKATNAASAASQLEIARIWTFATVLTVELMGCARVAVASARAARTPATAAKTTTPAMA